MPVNMKLESVGILIDMRPLNERDSLARVFTADFGVLTGIMRGAIVAKKNKPLIGQVGTVSWNARLDSQVGVFHWEGVRNMAAYVMSDAGRLGMLNAAFALIAALLPERERYDALYAETLDFLAALPGAMNPVAEYLKWEENFLRDIGYALDLSACAGCGRHDNLNYLSPRTCRAVCDDCAAPYVTRLYTLPMSLDTGRRLLEHICVGVGSTLPPARQLLRDK